MTTKYYLVNRKDPDGGHIGPKSSIDELFEELREWGVDNDFDQEDYEDFDLTVVMGEVKADTSVRLEVKMVPAVDLEINSNK